MSKQWIAAHGASFVDTEGRQVILRGVNLGGDCKLPFPDGGTDKPSDFSNHREVSFIGRPLPLEEADEHLGRIAGWGFNVLRLLVTWEAVEHAGPRQYDCAYLDYIRAICVKAAEHRLAVFLDFHQDVWSRMSGGSGAPCWTFDALGLDYRRFDTANAAHVMQYRYDYASPVKRQEDRYPSMSWPLNYRQPANCIMWTAFFAGKTFTPDWKIDGINVQDYLQDHYCGSMRALAERVVDLPNVIGFDTLNEPGLGWIGKKMTERPSGKVAGDFAVGLVGPAWTPFDGLRVARGLRTSVPQLAIVNDYLVATSEIDANPQGISLWKDGVADPFEQAGVWKIDHGVASFPDEHFFARRNDKAIDAEREFMQPFFQKVAATIRPLRAEWLLFAEINPHVIVQGRSFPPEMPAASVNASHWYDIVLLVSKHFGTALTATEQKATFERYRFQLMFLKMFGDRINGGAPTLIGECGIPYDINDGESYARWAAGERGADIWSAQTMALSLMYDALDSLLLSSTQWNYTASNRNDLRVGDGWNQEDLSIYSRDQHTDADDPDSGGRAVEGFCRPYVQRAQGRVKQCSYNAAAGTLNATIDVDPGIKAATEIYVPKRFSGAPEVSVGGDAQWSFDAKRRLLRIMAASSAALSIEVRGLRSAPAAPLAVPT
ncbi:endoglucanase [Solimonas sp. K1W22B-7]|uniref:glycoside hydrolase family 5 protein n=1 Tax=Solimonas sp. K1W22B-7 TaxID=2303331 RepID=UPI000E32EBED|nr:cellulase family glycosylhydrolase [Solimonas sp. K1W22B-7]AXQ31277.1 endoglucanase [Solimonas sp. K1W22B-7]